MKPNLSEEFKLVEVGRLALRVEGETWQAYYALSDTMNDAIPLASIRMALVMSQERKEAFIALMRECVGDIIEAETGHRPAWPEPPHRAPEHERSGRA
jgi:hypothetical protein